MVKHGAIYPSPAIGGTYDWGLPATAPAPTPIPEVPPLLDTDSDGIPDAQELLAPSTVAQGTRGTDPRDPHSVLRLSPRDKSATGLTLQFPTQPGKTYRIEYTDDLTTNQWHPLTDPIPGDGQPLQVLDPAAPNASTASASCRRNRLALNSRCHFKLSSILPYW